MVVNDTNMVEARFTNDASVHIGVYRENNGSMQTHYTAANAEFQSLSGYITGVAQFIMADSAVSTR